MNRNSISMLPRILAVGDVFSFIEFIINLAKTNLTMNVYVLFYSIVNEKLFHVASHCNCESSSFVELLCQRFKSECFYRSLNSNIFHLSTYLYLAYYKVMNMSFFVCVQSQKKYFFLENMQQFSAIFQKLILMYRSLRPSFATTRTSFKSGSICEMK